MNARLLPTLRIGVIALLAVGLVTYVRRVAWLPVLISLRHASVGLLMLALCFHWLALMGKAGIWWTFLRPLGGPRFTVVGRGTLMGATLNSLFVGSSGEAGRVLLMSRLTGIPSASVLATVVLERVVDLFGFLTLLACAAVLFPAHRAVFLAVCVGAGFIAIALIGGNTRGRPGASRRAATNEARSLVARGRRYAQSVLATTNDIVTPRRISAALALTLCDWGSELVSYSLVAGAVHFPLGVRGSLLALLAVNVGFLVRVTPGNVGVFELVYATVAHSIGLPYDVALGVALMLHLVQDVPTALLGLSLGTRFFARASFAHASEARMGATIRPELTLPSSAVPHAGPARGSRP